MIEFINLKCVYFLQDSNVKILQNDLIDNKTISLQKHI